MKTVQTAFIRAIIAVVVGLLLIKYREDTVTWITIIIGVLFIISGLISCIVYLVNRNAKPTAAVDVEGRPISLNKPTFPVVGIGSLVLGVVLAAFPNLVVNWMVYIFGAILIFGAVGQYVTLAGVVKLSKLSLYFCGAHCPLQALVDSLCPLAFPWLGYGVLWRSGMCQRL